MAYSDYGAFVYCNGKRRHDKEDVATFATDEETFGESSDSIPSGYRIWCYLLHQQENGTLEKLGEDDEMISWINHIHHGIMGDGPVRVMCHKQGLPSIYEFDGKSYKKINFEHNDKYYEYSPIDIDYNGHHFHFESSTDDNIPYAAYMTDPEGNKWMCKYNCEYGAGFTDVTEDGKLNNLFETDNSWYE